MAAEVQDSKGPLKVKPLLRFTNSSPSISPSLPNGHPPNLSGQALLDYRSKAALKLHHLRLAGLSDRWALSFLMMLSLFLAWLIGYYNASPALLVLLGLAGLAVGRGRWQQAVEGARLEAELKVQRKLDTQLRGETAEWMNFLLNRWWTTCSSHILAFTTNYVEPLIADLLPSGIDKVEVLEVDFGPQTPTVSNMKMSDLPTSKAKKSDLDSSSTSTLMLNFDLSVSAPDSRIVLRARVGSKSVKCNHLVYINGLYLTGEIQALVTLNSHAPFPNVTKIAATFLGKPDLWFSVKVLKGLQVTNVPFLKNFIHSAVMDVFTTLLVDPGKLTLNFDPTQQPADGLLGASEDQHAEGVVIVRVRAKPLAEGKGGHEGDPHRWISLRLGQTKYQRQLVFTEGVWQASYAFLVHSLQQDMLVLKVKIRRIVYNTTLAEHHVGLDSLGFKKDGGDDQGAGGEEAQEERNLRFSNSEVDLEVCVCYFPLLSFSLHAPKGFPPVSKDAVCGVLSVHVHRGQDLRAADTNGLSDPYCIVQANKQQILRTPHITNTLSPCWEKGVEVLVADITQVVLNFLVLDWDGPLVEDDLLGVAKFSLPQDTSEMVQHHLELGADTSTPKRGVSTKRGVSLGKIVVTIVFRPVASVGGASPDCHVGGASAALTTASVATIKGFKLSSKDKEVRKGVASPHNVLEFQLSRGYDLIPKDSNGLSDPYVVVKYSSRIVFRSKVVKKSLNPEWNQVASLTAPAPDDVILVQCWDKDVFSDDFLGSIQFTIKDLHIFREREQWCRLDHVQHGQLLLRLFLSEDKDQMRWSHLDEASRQLVGNVPLEDRPDVGGSVLLQSPSERSLSSTSSQESSNVQEESGGQLSATRQLSSIKSAGHLRVSNHTPSIPSSSSTEDTLPSLGSPQGNQQNIRRRHTLAHQPRPPDFSQFTETDADIQWALNRATDASGGKLLPLDRTGAYKEKQITVYHNVSGQVVEATGLKGDLSHMELYVKLRMNTRPSYQRQHKFGRGPVVHKTRVLRGSHSPQWKEDFMVKESPVPSDSLLTLDLKRGSKVNIGTYAITLDKFFDGQLKATRTFDIGNDVKLKVKISRQLR